jgi:hypothetical protein
VLVAALFAQVFGDNREQLVHATDDIACAYRQLRMAHPKYSGTQRSTTFGNTPCTATTSALRQRSYLSIGTEFRVYSSTKIS